MWRRKPDKRTMVEGGLSAAAAAELEHSLNQKHVTGFDGVYLAEPAEGGTHQVVLVQERPGLLRRLWSALWSPLGP